MDQSEDVLGALYHGIHSLNWSSRFRVILLFTDNPPHGKRFHTRISANRPQADFYYEVQNFPPQTWLEEGVKTLCEKRIVFNLFFVRTDSLDVTSRTVKEFQTAFNNVVNGKDKFFALDLKNGTKEFLQKVLSQVTSSMMAAGAKRVQVK